MEDRLNGVSRWLVALTVVFIPLSIFILISGPWSANYGTNQWTRYLLFASWILLTLSLIAGVANLIAPPLEEENGKGEIPMVKEETDTEEEEKEKTVTEVQTKRRMNMEYSLLMAQATTFLLGIIIYVVYISWMVLPEIPLRSPYG